MEQILTRRLLILAAVGTFAVLAVFFVQKYLQTVNAVNAAHNAYKRFLFLFQNAEPIKRETFSEAKLRAVLRKLGVKLRSYAKRGNEVVLELTEVRAEKLPLLVAELEKFGQVVEMRAVDNTGEGNFYAKVVLRLHSPA